MITVLMYASQTAVATLLYQFMILTSNTSYMIFGIIASTVIISVFSLLAAYIFNILGSSERGIQIELSQENDSTVLDSIDPLSFGISIGAICLILSIVVGIIMIISESEILPVLTSILISFIVAFIMAVITAVFYNIIAPRLGKLKFELI